MFIFCGSGTSELQLQRGKGAQCLLVIAAGSCRKVTSWGKSSHQYLSLWQKITLIFFFRTKVITNIFVCDKSSHQYLSLWQKLKPIFVSVAKSSHKFLSLWQNLKTYIFLSDRRHRYFSLWQNFTPIFFSLTKSHTSIFYSGNIWANTLILQKMLHQPFFGLIHMSSFVWFVQAM